MLRQHILRDKDTVFDLTFGNHTLAFTKQAWQGVIIFDRDLDGAIGNNEYRLHAFNLYTAIFDKTAQPQLLS